MMKCGRQFALLASWFVLCARGDIIDRIAVTIDSQVVTQSRTVEELRITAFLNGEKLDLGPANRRRAAERLVEQALIQREMELTQYPAPEETEIEASLQQVKSRFAGPAGFERDLQAYGIGVDELKQALARQATVLQFIELRFRPEVQLQETEVREYFEKVYLPEVRKKQLPEPKFEEARGLCEEALAQQLVDKRVASWLNDAKTRTRIRYVEEAFR